MESTVIKVEGMSCEHCVKSVKDAVGALPGVASVKVDLKGKTAAVDYDPAVVGVKQIADAIEDQGYDVAR